ncbi:MAG: hypothetical protein ACOX6N_00210 [Patescibacteria group bacterium]|jgi:hypothetical protein
MTVKEKAPLTGIDFSDRPKPKGLFPDGTFDQGHIVTINGRTAYVEPGPGIANLLNTRYEVEIQPRFERKDSKHNGRGSRD